jgi:uncharacterized membrane protein YgcG
MTEEPRQPRAGPSVATKPDRTTTTKAPDPKRPYHVAVAIGVTTSAYAVSLMAASTIQIQHDRALIEDREPVAAAIVVLADHHDDMASRLELARARYTEGADGYGALVARLDSLRARLRSVDKAVTAIERANNVLAANIPGVSGQAGLGSGRGGSGGGGGSSGSGSTAPRSVPAAPQPVAAPPTSGSTGASGAP